MRSSNSLTTESIANATYKHAPIDFGTPDVRTRLLAHSIYRYLCLCIIFTGFFFSGASAGRCINTTELGIDHGLKRHIVDGEKQKALNLSLAISDRVEQRLTTMVFKIFLEEVIGYENVTTTEIQDYNWPINSTDYLTNGNPPRAMVNMDLWLPPSFSEDPTGIIDCGTQGTGARFGWYVTDRKSGFIVDHWRAFLKEEIVSLFALSPGEEELVKLYTLDNKDNHFCSEEKRCKDGVFVPDQCKGNKTCATLFAGDFRYSSFLPDQVTHLKMLVKIAWIGPNLTPEFVRYFRKSNSIVFFSWWPSSLSVLDGFLRVLFPPSLDMDYHHLWKYEFHSIGKRAWHKLESIGLLALQSIIRFILDEEDYRDLLLAYNNRTALRNNILRVNRSPGWDKGIIEDIACNWLNNTARYKREILSNSWPPLHYDKKPKLKIAAIFPIRPEKNERYANPELALAAYLAKEDINKNNKILTDYDLEIQLQDGQCNSDKVLYALINILQTQNFEPLVGILGPGCSHTLEPLAGTAKLLNIIIVSYSAEGTIFNSNKGKYPYFFRTIPENKLYRYVYYKLFKQLGWKNIASLAEDGNGYSGYLTHLKDLLQDKHISIFNRKIPKDNTELSSYLDELKKKENRIIIVDFYSQMSRKVICEAYRQRMTAAEGYVWFLPRWLPEKWYHAPIKTGNATNAHPTCTTEEMKIVLDGHLSLGHAYFMPDNETFHNGESVGAWKHRLLDKLGSDRDIKIPDYGGYTYDAVWMYAFALDRLMKESFTHAANMQSNKTRERLVELLQDTNFTGVSGHIAYGDGPSRLPTTVKVMQFDSATERYHATGQFIPNDKKEDGVLLLNHSAFIWKTKDGKPPWDGSPSCMLDTFSKLIGYSCEITIFITMMIVFVIFILITISIFVVYKLKFEKIEPSHWRPNNWLNMEEWEVSRERVVTNRKIGEGLFGTVYGGECLFKDDGKWDACAVKTLKVGSTSESKLEFLEEAEMMKRFNHKNIVRLLGLCTREEPLYMIMEFVLYGNLKLYLLSRRHLVSTQTMFDDDNEISTRALTSMALDVAMALDYLSTNKYVHRDVACRNCLVSAERVVKLSDFGMTRPVYDTNYYRFSRKGFLPLRWTAPESLEDGIYTFMTDMWSYGVLLYEIITFGSFPYKNITDDEVIDHVKGGGTIRLPADIKPELEKLLLSCWSFDPNKRPTFSKMIEIFSQQNRLICPYLEQPQTSVEPTDNDNLDNPDSKKIWMPKNRTGNILLNPMDGPSPSSSRGASGLLPTYSVGGSSTPVARNKIFSLENGKGPVVEPLLPNDSYIGRYACLQLQKSPIDNNYDRETHMLNAIS